MTTKKRNSFLQFATQALRQGLLLITFLMLAGSVYLATQFHLSQYFPINTVKVIGLAQTQKKEIEQTVRPFVLQGFFTINVESIRDRLLQLPWAAEVSVRRRWPDEVIIIMREKTAVARWNHESLLSSDGQLFDPKETSDNLNLVDFAGPDGQQITMLKYFVNINRILAPLHAKISYLELTSYLTWKLTLENGMTLKVGHNDILTRLDHFVKVYPKIVGDRASYVEYIDLRYPNGMAVKWKNEG